MLGSRCVAKTVNAVRKCESRTANQSPYVQVETFIYSASLA
jgi:hypothetical protein